MSSLRFRHVISGSLAFVFPASPDEFIPPFPTTLTTIGFGPKPLVVVWTLPLQSGSEGPSLIACAARLHRFNRAYGLLSAPSWRTETDQLQAVEWTSAKCSSASASLSAGLWRSLRRIFTVTVMVALQIGPAPESRAT